MINIFTLKMSVMTRISILNRISKAVIPVSSQATLTRVISTSKKNQDTLTVTKEKSECVPAFKETSENWVSFGFDTENKEEDRHFMHATFFWGITVCIVFGGFCLAYRPDYQKRDWALREAFLELRRREREGLPLIDHNFLPESQIILPSDEELANTEIII